MKKVLQEALLVAVAGTAFAFAANALSPLGLRLTRNYFPGDKRAALPACQAAQQIIVYCNGGECEDSEFATVRLRDEMGVAREKLYIYAGGIKEWEQRSLPVESGSRNSGKLRGAIP